MSASKLGRSGSESWSIIPHTAEDGLTDTATAAAASPCETHDAVPTSALLTQRQLSDVDNTEAVMQHDEDNASEASADSWVEVTAAELQSESQTPSAATSTLAVAVAVDDVAGTAVATPPVVVEAAVAADVDADVAEQAEELPTPESVTLLRPTEEAAVEPGQQHEQREQPSSSSPAPPSPPVLDLSEFLASLALTRAYNETATEKAPTEHEAAAMALASFDAVEPTDDFTLLATEDREMGEETVDVDVVPSSLPVRRHVPAPTGVTAVLRRRMVAEDWLRTLRGPSPLTPEERVEVFQALFGDPGNAPISAERFREMMVPFDRHCDCLGASYGFHHQGCRYNSKSQLTS